MSIGIGIVGTGYIADFHARGTAELEGAELRGVVDLTLDGARKFVEKYGGSGTPYDSVAALAADPNVQLAILATPNAFHEPHALELLKAGKHILVEKPMAPSVAACERMEKAAKDANRLLMVGHMWRFDREALWVKERIDSDAVGKIVKTKSYGIHLAWGPSGWFVEKAAAGGGALIDMGVHAIDTTRFFLGDPDPVRVYAHIRTVHNNYDVDDLGVIVIEWDSDVVSVIESGWWSQHVDGPEASTQLFGTEGYLRLFPTEQTRIKNEKQDRDVPSFPERAEHCDQHIYTGQLGEMLASIANGKEPVPGSEHGKTVMRICEAAYQSSIEGRAIDL